MFKNKNLSTSVSRTNDAIFIGWQPVLKGEAFPLFTITASGHTSCGSTVSDKTLREMNLEVPQTPPLKEKG